MMMMTVFKEERKDNLTVTLHQMTVTVCERECTHRRWRCRVLRKRKIIKKNPGSRKWSTAARVSCGHNTNGESSLSETCVAVAAVAGTAKMWSCTWTAASFRRLSLLSSSNEESLRVVPRKLTSVTKWERERESVTECLQRRTVAEEQHVPKTVLRWNALSIGSLFLASPSYKLLTALLNSKKRSQEEVSVSCFFSSPSTSFFQLEKYSFFITLQ